MKMLVTLMLVYMLFSEALQGSAALRCYKCEGPTCDHEPVECSRHQDRCIYDGTMGSPYTVKGCATKAECGAAGRTCCDTDLCNKDLQPPTPLKCYECKGLICDHEPVTCRFPEDRCFTMTEKKYMVLANTVKGCSPKTECDKTGRVCCDTDLCNSAEVVKLSLLIMLVPLIPSILFI
ncbi:prostate stem cell antigen-like [Colossoma macropomum]|uniref:prostate stem cell antigen-like n=1 Tax=Colossoma macropomum TaxID=42526 RepID=UPI0018652487|nr:prostate stem cell antigen-like [Colossoma macropomum]